MPQESGPKESGPKVSGPKVSVPVVPALVAVLGVGALVGLAGVGLGALALRGCEAVRGVDSCGRPGILVLLAVVFGAAVVGRILLGLMKVPSAGSISLVGTALAAVVLLLSVGDQPSLPLLLVAVPAVSALAFAAARWITTRQVEYED